MMQFHRKLQITFLTLFSCCLGGQLMAMNQVDDTYGKSQWKGFTKHEFKLDNKDASLVVPDSPKSGNPWVWRARFPEWHTEADSILVSEGYHLAYVNTNDMYGSPQAMDIWDHFYTHLTTKHKLNQMVSLMGVSRGGLFVYNWAKRNPEKVISIYAEAPVCDFKSWPAGFGESEGSASDWGKLKKAYHFDSDREAKDYHDLPINNLKVLADQKIPVLHMIGLEDQVVPVAENTQKLITNYISLGGIATVVPCTQGEQKLKGHHFPIETPRYVADFIQYHTAQYLPIASEDYHVMRGDMMNSLIKFEKDKKGRVVFLGGSITNNPGWRDSICAYLQIRFPETEFDFVNAGIPSMGSIPGAFRMQRDVFSRGKVDLLFEEAAVNDRGNHPLAVDQIRGMEGIIRQCRDVNPEMDIVMMHFVDPHKIKDYNAGVEPDVITNHNRVAERYNIHTINLAKEVTDRINNGEFTWKDDFKNLHPSPFGQGVYAHSMITFLSNAYSTHIDVDDKVTAFNQPEMIDRASFANGVLYTASEVKAPKDWFVDQSWNPNDGKRVRNNYVDVPMLITEKKGSVLKFKFEGNAVGIAVAASHDAGIIEYRIDKGEWQEYNLYHQNSKSFHLPKYYTLGADLSQGKHLLEIRMTDKKDKRSTGNACRIRYFYVNK